MTSITISNSNSLISKIDPVLSLRPPFCMILPGILPSFYSRKSFNIKGISKGSLMGGFFKGSPFYS
jgi:hypothetical protein